MSVRRLRIFRFDDAGYPKFPWADRHPHPLAETVDGRYAKWLAEQKKSGCEFTTEQGGVAHDDQRSYSKIGDNLRCLFLRDAVFWEGWNGEGLRSLRARSRQ